MPIGCALAQAVASPQPLADRVKHIRLGQSAIPLYGPWKFAPGDSPIDPATRTPLWAEPGFDDSTWETVDLTPKTGSFDPLDGAAGYVPGWTARGHAGYWGYAWYRIRVQLDRQPDGALALAGPSDVDDSYECFDNGALMGSFGTFKGSTPTVYYTQPMMFSLPQPSGGNLASPTHVLSFRVWMQPEGLTNIPDVGGFHTAPVLGEAATVTAQYQLRWLELVRAYVLSAVEALLYALLAVVAVSLILFDRSDRVYLWMGAVFMLIAVNYGLTAFDVWTQYVSIRTDSLITDGVLFPLICAGWVMVWWVWFGRQGPLWFPRAVAALTLLYMFSNTVGEELLFGFVPHPVAAAFHMVSVDARLVFFGLLVWIVIQGIRIRGVEGWLVLPAVLLRGIGIFQPELDLLHIRVIWFPLGVRVAPGEVASLLLAAVLALLLLRRLLLSVRRQRLMALDVLQAQEVQQIILPKAKSEWPGLLVESEYRSAREVGGDFFQIIPHPTDGSLLIVAGDVTGKGLQAGMLVALLIGATHTAAQYDPDPLTVLNTLNLQLCGRGQAHATCLALRIGADGDVTLANAGHLPPYLNGEPVAMEGALPLGMIEGSEFSVMHFHLRAGDKLVLMSDGIPEATDANGQLFGFDRIHELLRTPRSAAEIANVAQAFGQEDDISVISVTRTPVLQA